MALMAFRNSEVSRHVDPDLDAMLKKETGQSLWL
jgi:hypothetical protein